MGGKKKAKQLLKKAGKSLKNLGRKVANDPEIRKLIADTASQVKHETLNGVRAGMSSYSGGRITGSGDYTWKTSPNINGSVGRPLAVASSLVIEREEFITPIVSHATAKKLTIQKFRVNPGNYLTHPWGSAIAAGYESYVPISAQILFYSTSGDALNSTDSSLGKVVLAAQYNSYARDWDSFTELENANDSVCGAPSNNLILGLECKKSLRGAQSLYVSSTDPASSGKGFYDLCDFYVATTGLQGQNVRVGDLKIRYRYRLFNPIQRDTELPDVSIFASGTNASANDMLAVTTSITAVENLTTKLGGTLTWAANSLTVAGLRPFVGKVRLSVLHNKYGGNGARTGPTSVTVAATGLGVALTVTADTLNIDNGSPANAGAVGSSQYIGSFQLPVETDSFSITFAGAVGVASDAFRSLFLLTAAESSDF